MFRNEAALYRLLVGTGRLSVSMLDAQMQEQYVVFPHIQEGWRNTKCMLLRTEPAPDPPSLSLCSSYLADRLVTTNRNHGTTAAEAIRDKTNIMHEFRESRCG